MMHKKRARWLAAGVLALGAFVGAAEEPRHRPKGYKDQTIEQTAPDATYNPKDEKDLSLGMLAGATGQVQQDDARTEQRAGRHAVRLPPGVRPQHRGDAIEVPDRFDLRRKQDREAWEYVLGEQNAEAEQQRGLTQKTLESLTADNSVSNAHRIRRHLQRSNDLAPYPLLNTTPMYYRFVASSDPAEHLGHPNDPAMDVSTWEKASFWREPSSLTQAFEMTGQGKASSLDKLVSWGTWLGTTRPFGQPNIPYPPTVLDMLYADSIMCWFASTLMTANAWWRGIPAINGATWNAWHQFTTARVENSDGVPEWMVLNANGGWDKVYVTNAKNADDRNSRVLSGFEDRLVDIFYDVPVPGSAQRIKELNLFKYSVIDDSKRARLYGVEYGTVDFPVTSRIFFADSDWNLFREQAPGQPGIKLEYRIEAVDQTCLNDLGIGYMTPLKYINPQMMWRGYTDNGYSVGMAGWATGRVETILPYGLNVANHPECDAYNLVYYSNWGDINVRDPDGAQRLLIQRFSFRDGSLVSLDPSRLECAAGARAEHCEFAKSLLREIPPKEQLPLAPW